MEGMATHSSILAQRSPGTEEPGGLPVPWGRRESDTTEHKQAHNPKKRIQKLGLIRVHLIQPLQRKQRNDRCLVWRKEKHDSLIHEGGLRVRNPRVQKIAYGQAGWAQTAANSSCVNSRDRRGIRYRED